MTTARRPATTPARPIPPILVPGVVREGRSVYFFGPAGSTASLFAAVASFEVFSEVSAAFTESTVDTAEAASFCCASTSRAHANWAAAWEETT